VLSADGKVPSGRLEKTVLLGELALDGRVRPVRGVLPAVIAAKREGWPAVVVPVNNLVEAALVCAGHRGGKGVTAARSTPWPRRMRRCARSAQRSRPDYLLRAPRGIIEPCCNGKQWT
jgi:hypothetical protein